MRPLPWILLVVLFAAVYLTRLGDGPLAHEEGRRATPAREMLHTGDFAVPRLYGEVYLHKPPLFFWLVASFGALLGEVGEWAVRGPSALSAFLCLVLVYVWGRGRLDGPTRWLAVLFALGCPMLVEKGRLGEIDLFLSLLVLAALGLWWRGYEAGGPNAWCWAGIGLLIGMSVLAKGPSGPLLFYLPVGCFLLWQRQLDKLFTWGHLLALVLAAAPTLAWVESLRQSGVTLEFLLSTWGREAGLIDVGQPEFVPNRPREWLRFFQHFSIGCLPLWPWLTLGVRSGLRDKLKSDAFTRFVFCAAFPSIVFVGLWPIGRARHALVVCYPLSVLAAMQVRNLYERWPDRTSLIWTKSLAWLPAAIAIAGAGGCSFVYPAAWPQVLPAALVFAGLSIWLLRNQESGHVAILARNLVCTACALAFCVVVLRSEFGKRRFLPNLRAQLIEWSQSGLPLYATSTYSSRHSVDYNLQFYLGPKLRPLQSVDRLPEASALVAAVYESEREALLRTGRYSIKKEVSLGRQNFSGELVVLELECVPSIGEPVDFPTNRAP